VSKQVSLVDQKLMDELIKFRKVPHQIPELAFDLAYPSKLITNELHEAGLDISNWRRVKWHCCFTEQQHY